jgi:hypothetical protein
LPADDRPLTPRSVVVALLAFLCGEQPDKAPSEALRIAEHRLSGITRRQDTAGSAALAWSNLSDTGSTLGEVGSFAEGRHKAAALAITDRK